MAAFNLLRLAKLLSPFCACLLLNILSLSPWGWDIVSHRSVPFVFGIVFYFAIFNPHALSGWAVFILGLATDAMVEAPFGIHGFIYSLLFFLVYFNRRPLGEMSFIRLWQIFAIVAGFLMAVWYLMVSVATGFFQSLSSAFIPYAFVVLTYPLAMWLSHGLDKWIRGRA
ncbi:MAG: rod shape-determining protein MreD [Alphaproteobacteria bacterium]|nr:rod shape-determining protein MreD [Alphaproteobacteria bacterium]